ncbi:MAG: hypothetical protein ACHQEB_05235 [Chitinophagales bacterium]
MKKNLVYKPIIALIFFIGMKISAQQPYSVTLRVNYNTQAKLFHNEPVLFTVSITNKEAQENERWNMAADRRLNELEELIASNKISREDYDKEKKKLLDGKKPVSSVTIGSKEKPWPVLVIWRVMNTKNSTKISLPLKALINPVAEPEVVLGEQGYYIAYFGIDPEDLKKIPEGIYTITASINGEASEAIQLNIQKENMSDAQAGSEAMLLKLGQYFWHSNNSKKAMSYVDMLLQKKSNSIDGLSLKGDVQVLDKSYLPALETYNKAVKEYYKQNPGVGEPPEYFLEMISWLKTQF